MTATARRLRFTAPRRVEVGEVGLPEPCGGEVLVRTVWSGISPGSEMLAYRGHLDPHTVLDEELGTLGGTFGYPFSYGYSCVGRVERAAGELGAGMAVFAFHPHQDRFVVPAADAVALPDGLDLRQATLFPLVETALQLTLDAGRVLGDDVVVFGLGPVGVLTALLLRRAGALVHAAEPVGWRRELAATLGIDAVEPRRIGSRVAEVTGGRGVPLVVELSGAPPALRAALDLLAHEGTALVGSWYGNRTVDLPLGAAFHRRRLSLRSSQVSTVPASLAGRWTVPRRRRAACALLGELPLSALATTEFPLREAAAAYAAIDRGERGLLHAALRYDVDHV